MDGHFQIVLFGQTFYQIPVFRGRFARDKFHLHILGQSEHLFPCRGIVGHVHAGTRETDLL